MSLDYRAAKLMTPELLDSISRLVNYAYAAEERDYAEMLTAGEIIEDDENHIFTHIRRLEAWLNA